jgi:hypothetical protein
MVRRSRPPPKPFSGHENFNYLLTELELAVEKGNIGWSPPTVIAAIRRLERLVATMQSIIAKFEQERERPN